MIFRSACTPSISDGTPLTGSAKKETPATLWALSRANAPSSRTVPRYSIGRPESPRTLLRTLAFSTLTRWSSVQATRCTRRASLLPGRPSAHFRGEPEQPIATGDFSERLRDLSERIAATYSGAHGKSAGVSLSSGQVTELVQKHDITKIETTLSEYLQHKKSVWILFDNLDRG